MNQPQSVEVQPVLYVFAGPNGAGKSTLFEKFQQATFPRIE